MAHINDTKAVATVESVAQRLLTVGEAAEYLSIGVRSVRQLVWEGKIDEVRFGKRVLLDIRDLDKFIDHSKRNALWDRD